MANVETPFGAFRFEMENIREFCGARHFFYFRSPLHLNRIVFKLCDEGFEGLSEEEYKNFSTFAELVYIEMCKTAHQRVLSDYRRNWLVESSIARAFQMRAQWWEVRHRPMYWVGKYFKAGAGREFINPNSGNLARLHLMPFSWNRYKKLCKKHNISIS